MRNLSLLLLLSIIFLTNFANAELTTPRIKSASFDERGRLVVVGTHGGYAGCYLSVYGGLNSSAVDTVIVGKQLSDSEALRTRLTLRTVRKYFCAKRNLYVKTELVCLGDEIGQLDSAVKRVAVPTGNVRR